MTTVKAPPNDFLSALPRDILVALPEYLGNIKDFVNLTSTYQHLRVYCSAASPEAILWLVVRSSPQPRPSLNDLGGNGEKVQWHDFFLAAPSKFIIAATARQLGNLARTSPKNEVELAAALQAGYQGLSNLCIEQCGLTLQRIRDLHASQRFFYPLMTNYITNTIDGWNIHPTLWTENEYDV